MPLFVPLLLGGEIVIAFLIARVGMWILRSWAALRSEEIQPEPPGGGVPALPERPRLTLLRGQARPAHEAAPLQRAA